MQSIKQSGDAFLVLGTETHRVSAHSQMVYAASFSSEHDALIALTHVIDGLTEVHEVELTYMENAAHFTLGLFEYRLTLVPVGQFEPVSHAYCISDRLRARAAVGGWPLADHTAPKEETVPPPEV